MTHDSFAPAALAFALLGLLVVLYARHRQAAADAPADRHEAWLLTTLAGASLLWYLALPPFQPLALRTINLHDAAHYYLGGKYLPELRYQRLYACMVLADVEDHVYPADFERGRAVRDLRDNSLLSGDQLARQDYQGCRRYFSRERWQAFANDVRFFRQWIGIGGWPNLVQDHGFNATPVWAIGGSVLSSALPLEKSSLIWLLLADYLLLGVAIGALAWAFGLRAAAVAVLVMTAAAIAGPQWTRGSLLRWDWLCVLAICWSLVRKERLPLLAGALAALAAALRLFPLLIFLPWGLRLFIGAFGGAPLPAYGRRFWVAFALGGLALAALPVGLYDPGVWPDFLVNLAKHQSNESFNNIGWAMLKPLFPADMATSATRALQVLFCALIAWRLKALAHEPDWVWLGLGTLTLPFLAPGLSNYYFMFLLLTATLAARWWYVAPALFAADAVSSLGRWYAAGAGATQLQYAVDATTIALVFLLLLWRAGAETKAQRASQ